MTSKVYSKQIGGAHYKDMAVQPSEFINKNKLLFAEGNAIKYICRHAHKGEVQDLEKAKHYIDMIIERDYGPQENWVEGYNKWKKLNNKVVVNNKIKLKDLNKLYKATSQYKVADVKEGSPACVAGIKVGDIVEDS
jgi:hypothetical protein